MRNCTGVLNPSTFVGRLRGPLNLTVMSKEFILSQGRSANAGLAHGPHNKSLKHVAETLNIVYF
jgi:hypothetical protein